MYENSLYVNPKIRSFWKNLRKNEGDFHPFKKNKNLVFFGNDLSKESFNFVHDRMDSLGITFNHEDLTNTFISTLNKENGNEDNLKQLAINAVSEAFEIPKEILNADLNTEDIDLNKTEENTPQEDYDYETLSQDLKDQINKRILINCLIQGSSIHAFYTLHHLVKEQLEAISSGIVRDYDKISVGTVYSYWKLDYSSMLENASQFLEMMVQGSSKVEYENEDEEGGDAKVVAKARTFVVLCQELVKGSMELISLNGLQDLSEEELKTIYAFADRRVDEPRYIQIGSEVWRKILSLLKTYRQDHEKISIPDFVLKISLMNPKDIESFFEHLLSGEVDQAINYLN